MIGRTLSGWGRLLGLGKTKSSSEDERRLWGRFPCDIQTMCKPTRNRATEEIRARVTNVSMGGSCLLFPVEFSLGELFSLRLPGPKDESSDVLACVVRCDRVNETTWAIGCTFASPLSAQELRRFDAVGEPASSDRRGGERFACQARAVYQIVRANEADENHSATIINISAGGLAIQPDQMLEIGELLTVDLFHGAEHVQTALASVVRTFRDKSRLVVGCNFIRQLDEEILARLLS